MTFPSAVILGRAKRDPGAQESFVGIDERLALGSSRRAKPARGARLGGRRR